MLSEPRAIFFSTELFYPEAPEFKISNKRIRELYQKLHEPGGYPYENLDLQDKPILSTRKESGHSICQVGPDRIRIEEDNPGMAIDEFASIVGTVLRSLGDDVGPFFLQRCTVRCLAQPNNCKNSRQLLANQVANVMDTIAPFERPPSFFGVRFRFEPHYEMDEEPAQIADESQGESAEEKEKKEEQEAQLREVHKGFATVRFETFHKDLKQVWMEVAASHHGVTNVKKTAEIVENVQETYKFLAEKCKGFLDQFDVEDDSDETDERPEEDGGK